MFNIDKGLIHMVFMNEDIYVKKSLITLNRKKNLYYELKKAGCKAVFQVTLNDQGYCLTCLDAAAKEIYRELIPEKKSILSKFTRYLVDSAGHIDQKNETVFVFEKENRKELFDVLSGIMNHKKNNAFVFSMDAVYSFQQNKKIVDFFLEQSNRNYVRRNLVVVESDASCEASFEMLTDENGFFHTDVFPAIQKICRKYENPRLYERLHTEMRDQIEYFNYMTREKLKNLVTLELMKKEGNTEFLNKIDDYTDFIFLAVNSPSFCKEIVMQNEIMKALERTGHLYCEIQKLLQNPDFCKVMEDLIRILRRKAEKGESLIDLAKRTDHVLIRQPFISWTSPILSKIDDISLQNTDLNTKSGRKRLQRIKSECRIPFFAADKEKQEKVSNAMDDYLNVAITGSQVGDTERLKLALEAMEFCLFECSKERNTLASEINSVEKDSYLAVLEYYHQALEEAESIFELKKQQNEEQERLIQYYRQQKENQTLLDHLMKDHNLREDEVMHSSNPISVKCISLKKNLVDTQKNIELINSLLKNVAMNLNSHEQTIGVIKNAITAIKNAKFSYNSNQLKTSSEIIRKSLEDAKENQREYEYMMEALHNSMSIGELDCSLLSSQQDEDELSALVNKN